MKKIILSMVLSFGLGHLHLMGGGLGASLALGARCAQSYACRYPGVCMGGSCCLKRGELCEKKETSYCCPGSVCAQSGESKEFRCRKSKK